MALPDSGAVEDFTEAEMMEIVQLFETDKAKLTKNQKAAYARYNFKKNKGEPIPFKGSGIEAAPAAPKPAAAPAAAVDIISLLAPEIQELAKRDPASLSRDEKIALAKAKSQAVRAQAAAGGAPTPGKPAGPSKEELAAKKAIEFGQAKELQAHFASAIEGWSMQTDKPYAIVKPERILDVVRYLQMEMGFDQIRDLTAVDYPPDRSGGSAAASPDAATSGRMEVIYNFSRHLDHAHIALKCKVPRDAPEGADMPFLPSIVSIYAGADWLEREVFDLFGIRFTGHPYMRRLMMPDGWDGHPLRKDYDSRKEQFIGLDERGNDVVTYDSSQGW